MDIIFARIVIFILILRIMVNTISTRGEQAPLGGNEIQEVRNTTRSSLGHLWKTLALSTMMIVGPNVFGQQTTQKTDTVKKEQITAMKGGNDTAILANNGTTTTTPATKPKKIRNTSTIDNSDYAKKIVKENETETDEAKAEAEKAKAEAEKAKAEAEKARKLAELTQPIPPK